MGRRRSYYDEAGPSRTHGRLERDRSRYRRTMRSSHADNDLCSDEEIYKRARNRVLRRRAFASRVHHSDNSGTNSQEENGRLRGQSPLSGRVIPERERSVSQESPGGRISSLEYGRAPSHRIVPLFFSPSPEYGRSSESPQYTPMSPPYTLPPSPYTPTSPAYYPMSPDSENETQFPEYRRESGGYVRVDVASNGGEDDVEGNHGMTFMDPNVLDCPICIHPLTVPVLQCENGHIACSLCSTKIRNKCPSCALPFGGHIRCRAIEKVIESVKVSCPNFKYGCIEKTSYCNKTEHENTCSCSPCSCPVVSCTFIGSLKQLSEHFTSTHPHIATSFGFDDSFSIVLEANQRNAVLQEKEGIIFILNHKEYGSLGSLINVSCILPITSKVNFPYILVAEKDEHVVKLKSIADNVAIWQEYPDQRNFLMVPRHFVDSRGDLKVKIRISNPIPIA